MSQGSATRRRRLPCEQVAAAPPPSVLVAAVTVISVGSRRISTKMTTEICKRFVRRTVSKRAACSAHVSAHLPPSTLVRYAVTPARAKQIRVLAYGTCLRSEAVPLCAAKQQRSAALGFSPRCAANGWRPPCKGGGTTGPSVRQRPFRARLEARSLHSWG